MALTEATSETSEMECSSSTENEVSEKDQWNADQSINQPKLELNDLTRDLNLIKESAQLLG